MSITQTVEIPASRRLVIDVPPEVPTGQAVLTFTPKTPVMEFANKQKNSALKNTDNSLTPHTDALLKILSNLGDVNIEQIREERLAKHL